MTEVRVIAVGEDLALRPTVADALRARSESIAWFPNTSTAERAIVGSPHPVELVVLGAAIADQDAVSVANSISRQSPTTAVVLVRDHPVNGEFPTFVRAGIRDVVDISGGTHELEDALRRALEWAAGLRNDSISTNGHAPVTRGRVVAVFSTKGGTGKTFVSCNLAAAFAAHLRQDVALVDLDHDLGDVFAYFGADPKRSLHELLQLPEGSDPQEYATLGTPLPGRVTGFGSPPDPRAEPVPSAAMRRMLAGLKEAFAFTVVDATSEYSDHVLATLEQADAVCFVTGLDVIGVKHMSIGMHTLETLGIPRDRFRVVLNRADSKVDLRSVDIERTLGIKIDARIPSSPLVPRSINHGRLLMLEKPRSEVAKAIARFARELVDGLGRAPVEAPQGKRRSGRRA